MQDIATTNTLLGLLGPMAILAIVGLNSMLFWSRRHSFTNALLGRGYSTQARLAAAREEPGSAGSNVLPFGGKPAVRRFAPAVRGPVVRALPIRAPAIQLAA